MSPLAPRTSARPAGWFWTAVSGQASIANCFSSRSTRQTADPPTSLDHIRPRGCRLHPRLGLGTCGRRRPHQRDRARACRNALERGPDARMESHEAAGASDRPHRPAGGDCAQGGAAGIRRRRLLRRPVNLITGRSGLILDASNASKTPTSGRFCAAQRLRSHCDRSGKIRSRGEAM
jgi:hypothetical protein